MLKFPINNLFIEGCDCSGKTTLVKSIHDKSGYLWHIHDRSQVSRLIFSEMYNRDISDIDYQFHNEISNLNNRWILLEPDINVIIKRFRSRGDELHSEESIIEVWKRFSKYFKNLKKYPNFTISNKEDVDEISKNIVASLALLERPILREIS